MPLVVEDYAVSAGAPRHRRDPGDAGRRAAGPGETYAWSHPETLTAALEHLDATYGGARSYLRDACGPAGNELEAVRRRLVR